MTSSKGGVGTPIMDIRNHPWIDDGSAGDALFDRLFERTYSAMQRFELTRVR
jgi:hypothetical protein